MSTGSWGAWLVAVALAVVCCGEEAPPTGGIHPTGGGPGGHGDAGAGGVAIGGCEGDEIRECKVQIDANNCFIGEQQCQDGDWSECLDAGSFE
jgi:hypothetical protein